MILIAAFRKVAVGSAILAIFFLAANDAEPQSLIFADGFELGSSAGWELSDEEILRALIDMPAPGSLEISRVLEVLARRGGLPVLTNSGTFLFAADCGSYAVSIAGDFNSWIPTPTTHNGDLCWIELSITVPEESGYKLFFGGNWFADPLARRFIYDTFGELSLVRSADAHLERWLGFGPSAGLASRELEIWVPAGGVFDRILYLQDGQNLFDPSASWGGWHLQDSIPTGMLAVGIHSSLDRINEYTPWTDDLGSGPTGGQGDAYADLVRFTIREFIEGRYGLAPVEGVMGSSLGGLISLHIAQRFPDIFDFSASMSGTLGWGSVGPHNVTIIEHAQSAGHQGNVIYLDSGGSGTCFDGDGDGIWDDDPTATDNYCVTLQMSTVLEGVGYVFDADLWYWWETDALHNEAAWAARVWRPLQVFDGLSQ
jgi:hypothetical protein